MVERKMHKLTASVFTHPDQVARIVVPDGCRVLLLVYGESPWLAPINEPGEYEVDVELLSKGRLPVAVLVIDAAHVVAWQAMPAAQVDGMLNKMQDLSDDR